MREGCTMMLLFIICSAFSVQPWGAVQTAAQTPRSLRAAPAMQTRRSNLLGSHFHRSLATATVVCRPYVYTVRHIVHPAADLGSHSFKVLELQTGLPPKYEAPFPKEHHALVVCHTVIQTFTRVETVKFWPDSFWNRIRAN